MALIKGEDGRLRLDSQQEVVFHLSLLIREALNRLDADERNVYGVGSDENDAAVQANRNQVLVLTQMREQFEATMAGLSGPPRRVPLQDTRREDRADVLVEVSLQARRAIITLANMARGTTPSPEDRFAALEFADEVLAAEVKVGTGG